MNRLKLILIPTLLAACTLVVAYAKSYDVNLGQPMAAGSVQLPAGMYRLEFTDSTATLTHATSRKAYKIPVRITTAEKKFKETSVDGKGGEPEQLKSIELGGSKIRLEFGQ